MKQTAVKKKKAKKEMKAAIRQLAVFDAASSAAAHRHLRKSHPRAWRNLNTRARRFEVNFRAEHRVARRPWRSRSPINSSAEKRPPPSGAGSGRFMPTAKTSTRKKSW